MLLLGLPDHTWGIIPAAKDLDCLAGSHAVSLPPFTLPNALTSPHTTPKISEGFQASTLDSIVFHLVMYTGGKGWREGPSLFLNTGR